MDGRAFASPAAGVRRYVRELVRALLALGEPLELVALGGSLADRLPPGIDRVSEPRHPPTNAGWTLVGLPVAARRGAVDLIHAPAYTAPVWATVPVVVTIHDVSYARHPEWYPYRRDRVRRWFYRQSARAARHVLTDSAFSRSEISAAYGVSPDKISVVPLGVDVETFIPAVDDGHAGTGDLQCPYLLHVGDLHPRRNLGVVIAALATLNRRAAAPVGGVPSLVLAGVDRGEGAALLAAADTAGLRGRVVFLGRVGPERLVSLYQGAEAFVYPSRYEGFGLPLLEAMACGTPVIAASASSIPEVVGDAGVLLDPDDSHAWAESIAAVIGRADKRRALRVSGLSRSAQYSWQRTAELTLDVYRRVAAEASRG
jgi:glycosyltransferase involved in cell wall biosynthesis